MSYNEGIAYEDEKDYKQAYSNFRRAYKVANELLGSSHPKTQKFKQALMEGRYKKIAKELNDDLEKLFMSNVWVNLNWVWYEFIEPTIGWIHLGLRFGYRFVT